MQDEPGEVVILREKATVEGQQDKQAGDNKQGSKRNSLDSKTVQGLAQDLAAECAKAYALMENSLTKFSTDFGPFGMTPRGRVSLTYDFILFHLFVDGVPEIITTVFQTLECNVKCRLDFSACQKLTTLVRLVSEYWQSLRSLS